MYIKNHNQLIRLSAFMVILTFLCTNLFAYAVEVNTPNESDGGNKPDKSYINFENAASYKAVTYSSEFTFDSSENFEDEKSGSSLRIEVNKPGSFFIPFLDDKSSSVRLEKGKTYVVEFYYKALIGTSQPIKIDFYASSLKGTGERTQLTGWSSDPSLNTQTQIVETTDGWAKKIVKFTVDKQLAADADNLAMGIYGETSQRFDYEYYMDNITVTCVNENENIVILNIPDGKGKTEVLHGVANKTALTQEMLDSRAVIKQGYAFDGWYTDAGCTRKYKVTGYFPDKDIQLHAKWIDIRKVKSYTVDFENYDPSIGGVMSVKAGFSGIYDGFKSLSASMPGTGYGQNEFRTLKTTDDTRVELKNNTTYVVTYFYNVKKDVKSDKVYSKIDFYRTSSSTVSENMDWNNIELVTDWKIGNQKTIISDTDSWQQVSCVFTANLSKKSEYKYLAIGVYDPDGLGVDIAFDNFVITEVNDSQRPLILNSNDESSSIKAEYGSVGENYIPPTPADRKGYVFAGWYSEPTFQNKITQTVFTTECKNLYAKWAIISNGTTANLGFENGYDGSANRGYSDISKTGKKSIGFKADGTEKTPASQFVLILDNDAKPYQLKDGASYVVTYWVKAKKIDAKFPFKFDFYRTDGNMSNDDRVQMTSWNPQVAKNTQIEINKSSDWTQVLTYFTVNLSSDSMHRSSQYLGLGCYLGETSKGVNGETFIDDMTIMELPTLNRAFILNVNDDKNTIKVIWGKAGEKADLPTYSPNDGMKFSGWTYDYEQKNKLTDYVFPEDNTRLYGMWLLDYSKPDYHITFEDYLEYNDFSDTVKASEAVSLSSEQAYEGKYSLKLESEGAFIPGQAFLYDKTNTLALEPGATYVINYNFFVPESKYVDIVELHFLTSSPLDRSNSWVKQTYWDGELELENEKQIGYAYSIRWNTETNVWHNHTTIMKANCTAASNALSIIAWGSKGSRTVYIDDITITKINEGNSYIYFDSNYTGGENTVVQGKIGQPCISPNPVREDYKFGGWFTSDEFEIDSECTDINSIAEKPVYLYAKWDRVKYIQNFENYNGAATSVDRDYELIDVGDGHASDLVYEGKRSMHRIGVSSRNKAFSIMTDLHDKLSMNEYVISMRVKVNSFANKNDYLQIVNTKSPYNAWSVDIGAMDVIKLSKISDGKWNQIAFRCKNIDPFFAVMTPGKGDVIIDDIQIYLTGYEPEFDNETIIINNSDEISLTDETNEKSNEPKLSGNIKIIIIVGAAVLLAVVITVLVICCKKAHFQNIKRG